MPEVLTATSDLFASDEFGQVFTEWQRARIISGEQEGRLAEYLRSDYDPSASQYEIDSHVSYLLDMSEEDFSDRTVGFSDDRSEALNRLRFEAMSQEDGAKDTLLEFSKAQGVSQFALYGLWLHTRESGVITKTDLATKVHAAETNFEVVDRLVRDNPGEVLTIVGTSVKAGRLGIGGININEQRKVVIPLASGTTSYEASLSSGVVDIYSDQPLGVDVHKIHGMDGETSPNILSPSELLDVSGWFMRIIGRGAAFTIGGVAEGPQFIEPDMNQDYYEAVLARIRAVERAAAAQ